MKKKLRQLYFKLKFKFKQNIRTLTSNNVNKMKFSPEGRVIKIRNIP